MGRFPACECLIFVTMHELYETLKRTEDSGHCFDFGRGVRSRTSCNHLARGRPVPFGGDGEKLMSSTQSTRSWRPPGRIRGRASLPSRSRARADRRSVDTTTA